MFEGKSNQEIADTSEIVVLEAVHSGVMSNTDFITWINAVRACSYSDGYEDGTHAIVVR